MRRVLVVDDEHAVREVCVRTLAADGFDVDSANDATQANGKLTGDYDVVLLDIRMPQATGLDLYRMIQSVNPSLL